MAPPQSTRALAVPAVVAALALILLGTLTPQSGLQNNASFFCLTCDEFWGLDVFLNIALFVPLGAALYLAGFSPTRIAIASFGLSGLIELLQWGVIPGRDPSLRDIISNGVGGALAGLLAASIRVLWREGKPVHFRRALAVVLVSWSAQALVTGWAVTPEAPMAHAFYGQWAHVFPETVPFRGRVIDARLNNVFVRDDSLAGTNGLRRGIDDAGVLLEVKVDSLPPSVGEAQVFGLVAGPTRILGLDVSPRGLRFESRSRAARLGLRRPSIRLPRPVSAAATALTIRAIHVRSNIALELVADGKRVQSARWRPSAARGLTLLMPRRMPASQLPLWSLCWIATFSIPAGLLLRSATGSQCQALLDVSVLIAAMVTPLLIASAAFQCALPTTLDIIGVAGGCAVGNLWQRWRAVSPAAGLARPPAR